MQTCRTLHRLQSHNMPEIEDYMAKTLTMRQLA